MWKTTRLKERFSWAGVDNCFRKINAERFLSNRGEYWENLSAEQG